jgi:fatty acid desaturase
MHSLIKKIKAFRNFGWWHCLSYLAYILTLIGLIVFPIWWILLAILLFIPLYHTLSVIQHDYICHNYITPKNNFWKAASLIYFSILTGETLLTKKNYHIHHHAYWNTDNDPVQARLKNNSLFAYVLELYQTPFDKPIDHVIDKLPTAFEIWIEKHTKIIFCIGLLLSFILMPIWLFFIVQVYCRCLMLIIGKIEEYYFHKTVNTDLSKDSSFAGLFIGGSAWHIRHHMYMDKPYYGSGIWKYLNLSWYVTNLAFNPNTNNK